MHPLNGGSQIVVDALRLVLVLCRQWIDGWPGLEGASPKPRGFLRSAQSSPGHQRGGIPWKRLAYGIGLTENTPDRPYTPRGHE